MEVWHWQECRALVLQPRVALGALAGGAMAIAARMRNEAGLFALTALIQMTAQRGRAARLDGAQRAPVLWRQSVRAGVIGQTDAQHRGHGEAVGLGRWSGHGRILRRWAARLDRLPRAAPATRTRPRVGHASSGMSCRDCCGRAGVGSRAAPRPLPADESQTSAVANGRPRGAAAPPRAPPA